MKKTNLIAAIIMAFIILTSFTDLKPKEGKFPPKNKTCSVWCDFKPSTSIFGAAGIGDCCDEDNRINTSGFVGTIDHTSGSVEISAGVGNSHPAGTITILKNGTVVYTHAVALNTSSFVDQYYSGVSCGDSFEVTW